MTGRPLPDEVRASGSSPTHDTGPGLQSVGAGQPGRCHPHTMQTRAELLTRVYDLTNRRGNWYGPAINTPAWWEATEDDQVASLVVLGAVWVIEHLSELDPEALKQASVAISAGRDWTTLGPSHAELAKRRVQPGPMVTRRHV